MWQTVIFLALVTSLVVSCTALAENNPPRQVTTRWYPYRYQADRRDPDSCIDSPKVVKEFKKGNVQILFVEDLNIAIGEVHGLHDYVLKLPLGKLLEDGSVYYKGEIRVMLGRLVLYTRQAKLSGRLFQNGFDFRVKYYDEELGCWKERYLRSPAVPPTSS